MSASEVVVVAQELLADAARLEHWSKAPDEADVKAFRALAARLNARAAFRLLGTVKEFRP